MKTVLRDVLIETTAARSTDYLPATIHVCKQGKLWQASAYQQADMICLSQKNLLQVVEKIQVQLSFQIIISLYLVDYHLNCLVDLVQK